MQIFVQRRNASLKHKPNPPTGFALQQTRLESKTQHYLREETQKLQCSPTGRPVQRHGHSQPHKIRQRSGLGPGRRKIKNDRRTGRPQSLQFPPPDLLRILHPPIRKLAKSPLPKSQRQSFEPQQTASRPSVLRRVDKRRHFHSQTRTSSFGLDFDRPNKHGQGRTQQCQHNFKFLQTLWRRLRRSGTKKGSRTFGKTSDDHS